MKNALAIFVGAILITLSANALSANEVTVMLVKSTTAIQDDDVRSILGQMNATLDNSNAGSLALQSATLDTLSRPEVHTMEAPCNNPYFEALINCVRNLYEPLRNENAADIVVALVTDVRDSLGRSVCGAVKKDMIDAPDISNGQQHLAYTVIAIDCYLSEPNGIKVASHEIGHLMSLEHLSDENDNFPVSDNHAAMSGNWVTQMAGFEDCASCLVEDFFSEAGKTFQEGGAAGNTSYSNAQKVLLNSSWFVVSDYRPLYPQNSCVINIQFISCANNTGPAYTVTASTPGFLGTIKSILIEASQGSAPWGTVFSGNPTCPTYFSQINMLNRIRAFVNPAGGGTMYCETQFIPSSNQCNDDPL